MKIEIQTEEDVRECETCGSSWAEGGVVRVDGKEVLRREPIAYCYGTPTYSESDLLVMALKKIDIDVFVDGERYQVCSYDNEYHECKLEDN